MRSWSDSDPKARLLARKQTAILVAARKEFLEKGFGETTMAGVAAAAGVSAATLYRHVRSKEELFQAVVTGRHDPEEVATQLARLAAMPLHQGLVAFGEGALGVILSPDAIAMHRMVIAEAERFPELGRTVHDATIGHVTDAVVRFLAAHLGERRAAEIAPVFIERLIGDRMLHALLGMPVAPSSPKRVSEIIEALIPEAAPKKLRANRAAR
jgi:AcrR family transcriptional regulator